MILEINALQKLNCCYLILSRRSWRGAQEGPPVGSIYKRRSRQKGNSMTRLSKPGIKSRLLAIAIGMAFLLSGWCHGARRHVRVDGDDSADGLSWATALASVQQAIDLSAPGDEVWVAAGRYEAAMRREVGSESGWAMSFLLRDGVSL